MVKALLSCAGTCCPFIVAPKNCDCGFLFHYFLQVSSTNSKSSCSLVLSAYDIVQLAVKSFSKDNLKPVEVGGILELLLMDTPKW